MAVLEFLIEVVVWQSIVHGGFVLDGFVLGGSVPDLVNALDLSRNSARAWIPSWVPRISRGYMKGEISSRMYRWSL